MIQIALVGESGPEDAGTVTESEAVGGVVVTDEPGAPKGCPVPVEGCLVSVEGVELEVVSGVAVDAIPEPPVSVGPTVDAALGDSAPPQAIVRDARIAVTVSSNTLSM